MKRLKIKVLTAVVCITLLFVNSGVFAYTYSDQLFGSYGGYGYMLSASRTTYTATGYFEYAGSCIPVVCINYSMVNSQTGARRNYATEVEHHVTMPADDGFVMVQTLVIGKLRNASGVYVHTTYMLTV